MGRTRSLNIGHQLVRTFTRIDWYYGLICLFVQRGLYPEPAMFQFSAAQHEEDTDDGSEAECEDEETPGGQQLCEVLPQLVAALTHWTMDCLHASRCAISKDKAPVG